jgi:hypothetical protein
VDLGHPGILAQQIGQCCSAAIWMGKGRQSG